MLLKSFWRRRIEQLGLIGFDGGGGFVTSMDPVGMVDDGGGFVNDFK